MNYIILDTEKTYNIGRIVVSSDAKILKEREYVIQSHFEDRRICGENNYNRKKKYFAEKKNIIFTQNPIQCISQLINDIKKYSINTIIGNQVSEDRIQIGQLTHEVEQYAKLNFSILENINWFDMQKLTKIIFPNNKTNLKDLVSDIYGQDIIQTHTALDDTKLCWVLLSKSIQYMQLFNYDIDFNNTLYYDICKTILTTTVFSSKGFLEMYPQQRYTSRVVTNLCNNMVEYSFLKKNERTMYGKTGKELKTKLVEYYPTNKGRAIAKSFLNFCDTDWIKIFEDDRDNIIISNDASLSDLKEKLEIQYTEKIENAESEYKRKEKILQENYRKKEQILQDSLNEREKEISQLHSIIEVSQSEKQIQVQRNNESKLCIALLGTALFIIFISLISCLCFGLPNNPDTVLPNNPDMSEPNNPDTSEPDLLMPSDFSIDGITQVLFNDYLDKIEKVSYKEIVAIDNTTSYIYFQSDVTISDPNITGTVPWCEYYNRFKESTKNFLNLSKIPGHHNHHTHNYGQFTQWDECLEFTCKYSNIRVDLYSSEAPIVPNTISNNVIIIR